MNVIKFMLFSYYWFNQPKLGKPKLGEDKFTWVLQCFQNWFSNHSLFWSPIVTNKFVHF